LSKEFIASPLFSPVPRKQHNGSPSGMTDDPVAWMARLLLDQLRQHALGDDKYERTSASRMCWLFRCHFLSSM
jgi:hypothetical protein